MTPRIPSDPAISARSMYRPNRRAGELLACALLRPAFLGAFRSRYPTPDIEYAIRELGPDSAILCGYAVGAMARPDLSPLVARHPRGRRVISAAIECLAGEGGYR